MHDSKMLLTLLVASNFYDLRFFDFILHCVFLFFYLIITKIKTFPDSSINILYYCTIQYLQM